MLAFHILLCLILAFFSYWHNKNWGDLQMYLYNEGGDLPSKQGFMVFVETFFSVFCLNSTFIPISLQLAIEVAKGF
jgi:hypothetical protein